MPCRRKPKAEQQRILATDEVQGFLQQSNISKKNIRRLGQLETIEDAEFQRLRTLVLKIAAVLPGSRKRWEKMRRQHPDLFRLAIESNQIIDELNEGEMVIGHVNDIELSFDEINLRLQEYAVVEVEDNQSEDRQGFCIGW